MAVGDDAHGEEVEAEVDVVAALVAGDEAAEAAEPGVGPLDLPAVPAEAVARLDAAPGETRDDPAPAAVVPAAEVVVALVAVQLAGPAARPSRLAAYRRHRVEHGAEQESTEARDQSIRSAPRIRASSSACTRVQTPAACQSRSRRQQVMPQPQPISRGSISHGIPDFSTNRMPVSAGRFSTAGRPPFGPGRGGGGSNGPTTAQRSSGSSACAMPAERPSG